MCHTSTYTSVGHVATELVFVFGECVVVFQSGKTTRHDNVPPLPNLVNAKSTVCHMPLNPKPQTLNLNPKPEGSVSWHFLNHLRAELVREPCVTGPS